MDDLLFIRESECVPSVMRNTFSSNQIIVTWIHEARPTSYVSTMSTAGLVSSNHRDSEVSHYYSLSTSIILWISTRMLCDSFSHRTMERPQEHLAARRFEEERRGERRGKRVIKNEMQITSVTESNK